MRDEFLSGFTVAPYANLRPGDRTVLYYGGSELRKVLVLEYDAAACTITVWPDTWANRLALRLVLVWKWIREALQPWLRAKVRLR